MAPVRSVCRLVFAAIFVICIPTFVRAQFAEQNVNMVSGMQWPGGDPFLRQQNEPSIAVSTRNPLHLLAGANDYRSVDIPFSAPARPDDEETGDAWLGVFRSKDGGNRWTSTLLDGYPQLTNTTSPLHGFQAAADPVVRAGRNGMFYYAGIVLNRGDNPLGGVFVARFIDNNNTYTGDPVAYLDTNLIDQGTSGQFIDKPWLAVAPTTNGGQCTVSGQTFPAQNIYLAYSVFVGNDNNIRTKIMFTRSTDCGATWAIPQKLSETYTINQGVNIAVDPSSGAVYVAWRRFHGGTDPDSIIIAKSINGGGSFTKGSVVTNITPFEQGTGSANIRTNAYPAIAVDNSGRVYIAWSQRDAVTGDGHIVMINSADGQTGWSAPTPVATTQGGTSNGRGHQFMPAMTFAAGKLTMTWYDLRDDQSIGTYTKHLPADGTYDTSRTLVGNLFLGQPQVVFWNFLADVSPSTSLPPLVRRHTLEVYATESNGGLMPSFSNSARVTRYKFGSFPPSYTTIQDMQIDPPNLPMFRQGTVPFIGDYIDVSAYITAPGAARVRHVVWTDNRDVRAPLGNPPDWTKYTPVHSPALGNTSIFDPTQHPPDCVVDNPVSNNAVSAGSRNQNIYTTRVTDGLFAGSPRNARALGNNITRSFVVFVQNTKNIDDSYHLAIVTPAAGTASFLQFSVLNQIDVAIPAHSTVTRTVFVNAPPLTRVDVNITENVVSGGLSTVVSLNSDPTNPDIGNPDIGNNEIFNPDIGNPDIGNPDIGNPDIGNPDIGNPDIGNPDIGNPDIGNPDIGNPDIGNPDIGNPDIGNGSVTDTTWGTSNQGNTTGGYTVKLVANNPLPGNLKSQLVINKIYDTPVARGCNLGVEHNRQIVASVKNPTLLNDINAATDPSLDVASNNSTFWLGPGESARITVRLIDPINKGLTLDATQFVTPVVISHSVNTADAAQGIRTPSIATPLMIITRGLPDGNVGTPYTVTMQSLGGIGTARTWSVDKGLPLGLTMNPSNGVISGTPIVPGDSFVTIRVADSANPANTRARTYSFHVAGTQLGIGGITPSTAAAGFGQLIFIDIANFALPTLNGAQVWFADGSVVEPGFLFPSPSTTGGIYARLPFAGDSLSSSNLNPGTINVFVTEPGTMRGPASITLSATPGTPTLRAVYSLATPPGPGTPCGGAMSSQSTTTISPGDGIAVSAYGTDTVGAKLRFVQGNNTIDVGWSCAIDSASLGEASVFTVPGALQPGTVNVAISTVVNGTQSAWSNATTLTVPQPAPLVITTTSLSDATETLAYNATLTSTGGTQPIHWSVARGPLPAGLTLNDNGTMTGTPTEVNFLSFVVSATDSAAQPQSTTAQLFMQTWATPSGFCGNGHTLFNNTNVSVVLNGGKPPTVPAIGRLNGYLMSGLFHYHWNNGVGSTTQGAFIGFTSYDPWSVTVQPATNNVPANWVANLPTGGVVINGTLTAEDSETSTWSENSESNGDGFTVVCAEPYFPIG